MSRRYVPDLNGHDVTLVAESIAPLERAIDVPVALAMISLDPRRRSRQCLLDSS